MMTTFYKLLDSGHGRKLEQYGAVRVVRPEPQALWAPALPDREWEAVDATFAPAKEDGSDNGNWQVMAHVGAPHTSRRPLQANETFAMQSERRGDTLERWEMDWHGLRFWARLTPFRHLGCFPDQVMQWDWVRAAAGPEKRMLNLFGYTGVMSMIAAREGSSVVHVDASKKAIGYGKDNAALAGLDGAKIRWLVDDALAFAEREVRRGNTYHTIVLDPPKFGRGPDGEVWDFMEHFGALAATLPALLAKESGAQIILTAYALRVSAPALSSALQGVLSEVQGTHSHGAITQTDEAGRAFDSAYWARFVIA